jgi:hypothetical protein
MPLYTFFPASIEGEATTFHAVELSGDRDVPAQARRVLEDHSSAQFVMVWCGDRKVGLHRRSPRAAAGPNDNSPEAGAAA